MGKKSGLLDDPIFAGEEFFFPPPDTSPKNKTVEFSKEFFKKAAQKILKDGSVVISRNAISKRRKIYRRRNKGMKFGKI